MSYMMRDRPDGQFEIVFDRPTLVGVFPERDMAEKVFALLLSEEEELVADEPASFGRATKDIEAFEAETRVDLDRVFLPIEQKEAKAFIPMVVEPKKAPPARVEKVELTEAQLDAAFARLSAGEKLSVVAPDFGTTLNQLRGQWASHCRHLQKHLAEGGQIACSNCERAFMPSLSHPDTCARCSK